VGNSTPDDARSQKREPESFLFPSGEAEKAASSWNWRIDFVPKDVDVRFASTPYNLKVLLDIVVGEAGNAASSWNWGGS
jgi:hypothetical protein